MAKNKLKKIPGHDLKNIDGLTKKSNVKKIPKKPKKKVKLNINFDYKKIFFISNIKYKH